MIIIHGVNDALPRALEPSLARALKTAPVVVVTGSRQTGKSTLVKTARPTRKRAYLTLDDLDVLARAQDEPDALLRGAKKLTLDEVQRAPELLTAVKRAVDEDRAPGRFVLTGSANFALMRRIAESLAGRATYLSLWPMTRREQLGLGAAGAWSELFAAADRDWLDLVQSARATPEDWTSLARRGGYPTPAHELRDEAARALWFTGFTRTYLERDLRDLAAVSSLVDFRRLMRAACLRTGSLVNQTELGRDVGMPQPTVNRYLSLLETSYQLVRLMPYSVNRTKRLIKAPKLYWSDTGLSLHLSGERDLRGAHLENVVLGDLLAWRSVLLDVPEVLYWRTATGDEVDFVIEWEGRLLPIEVKATTRPRPSDAAALRTFRKEYPDASRAGLLLHAGGETSWIADGVLAAPWWRLF